MVSCVWRLTEHDCLNLNGKVTHLWLYIYIFFFLYATNPTSKFILDIIKTYSNFVSFPIYLDGTLINTVQVVVCTLFSSNN